MQLNYFHSISVNHAVSTLILDTAETHSHIVFGHPFYSVQTQNIDTGEIPSPRYIRAYNRAYKVL